MGTVIAFIMTVYIYALCCPFTGEIRYVGKTCSTLKHRLNQHIHDPKNSHNGSWFKHLKSIGLRPTIEVLEEIHNSNDKDWQQCEIFWIEYCRFLGFELTNLEKGGFGGTRRSPETRDRIRSAVKGKKRSAEFRERMKTVRIGFKMPVESVRQGCMKRKGWKPTPEHRAKLRDSNLGKKASLETRAKLSAAHKGRKITADAVAKMHAGKTRKREFLKAKHGTQLTLNL